MPPRDSCDMPDCLNSMPRCDRLLLVLTGLTFFAAGCGDSADDPEVLVERGNLLREAERFEEAGDVYRQAVEGFLGYLEDSPNDAYCHFELGQLYFYLGERPEAIEAYERSMELSSEYAEDAVAWYNLGTLHFQLEEHEEALECYDTAIRYDPQYVMAYNDRGWLYFDILNNPAAALRDFDEALKIDPNHVFSIYNRAVVHEEAGNYELAMADMDRAIELEFDNPMNFRARGDLKREMGKFDEAIEDYSQAIAIDDEFAPAYYGRGLAFRELGKEEEANSDFDEATRIDRNLIIPPIVIESSPVVAGDLDTAVTSHLAENGYENVHTVPEETALRFRGERDSHEVALYVSESVPAGHIRIMDSDLTAIRAATSPVDLVVVSTAGPQPEVVKIVPDWSPGDADMRPVQFEIAIP